MSDRHVSDRMAPGNYKANVTYDKEKFRHLTGDTNRPIVPDTQLPEFDISELNAQAMRICNGIIVPDYSDPATISYPGQELIESRRSKGGWKLFFYQNERIAISCSLDGATWTENFPPSHLHTFTVSWKKLSEFGRISLGSYVFEIQFGMTSLSGWDPGISHWTAAVPMGSGQYSWAPSHDVMTDMLEATHQFRIVANPHPGIKKIRVLFSSMTGKRPVKGVDDVTLRVRPFP